jgi:hypothetical protein
VKFPNKIYVLDTEMIPIKVNKKKAMSVGLLPGMEKEPQRQWADYRLVKPSERKKRKG